eukprot:UN02966
MYERGYRNTFEQQGAFLFSLWFCAIFADKDLARNLGIFYIALRVCYPIAWAWGGGKLTPIVPCFTMPQYGIVYALNFAPVAGLMGWDYSNLYILPAFMGIAFIIPLYMMAFAYLYGLRAIVDWRGYNDEGDDERIRKGI